MKRAAIKRTIVPRAVRCVRTNCTRLRLPDPKDGGLCFPCWKKAQSPKKSRYGVARVKDDEGRSYASKAERAGMADLRAAERRGDITGLEEQVTVALYIGPDFVSFIRCTRKSIALNVNRPGTRIDGARWDAAYYASGVLVFADVKNRLITDDFRRHARWMDACGYPVKILDYGKRKK